MEAKASGLVCGLWMRDDRIGGLDKIQGHFAKLSDADFNQSLALKQQSVQIWASMMDQFEAEVRPKLKNLNIADAIEASLEYGWRLFSIVEAGWRVMIQGYRKTHNKSYSESELRQAITDYDSHFGAYRAFGLANQYAASLYHPYYLCLGTSCTGAFDPPAGSAPGGIGATVDSFRNSTAPPEPCQSASGFKCTAGHYCADNSGGTMVDWYYSGMDNVTSCLARCSQDASCTCAIHRSNGDQDFPNCRLTAKAIVASPSTARGYNEYLRV